MGTYKYRDVARPQLDALMEARKAFPTSHPVYGCAQVISHLAYRGPDQKVEWLPRTPVGLPQWANSIGVLEGMALPDAMRIALHSIRVELARERGMDDAGVAAIQIVVSDLESALGVFAEEAAVAWPTVRWVKDPVVVETGLPNGEPITMRHFKDCTHWFREPDGRWIGDPPRLATNDQMENLPACRDCIREATKHNNPATGMRTSLGSEVEQIPAQGVDLTQSSDAISMVRRRVEQRFLRRALLDGRDVAPCALCGRALPAEFLIAAHIVPRHRLTEAERYDFVTAAMLACTLGCDALFEGGYLAVDESGRVEARRESTCNAVLEVVRGLLGRSVTGVASESAPRFAEHRRLHSQ